MSAENEAGEASEEPEGAQSVNEGLSAANRDLQNFLASTDIGTIFLDRELGIKRYTPAAEALFHFLPADLGRPLAQVTHRLDYPALLEDAASVLARLAPVEREVASADGQRHFLARLLPVRSRDDRIEGVVVHFVDITQRKRAEQALRESEERQAFLLKLSDALRPLGDPVEVQATAARVLGEHLGADRACYVEIDEARQEFVVARDWRRRGAPPSPARRYPLADWPMPGLVDGRAWVVRDVDSDPAIPDDQRESCRRHDIGAAVVVPLIKEGRVVATLVTSQQAPRSWTPHEIVLVEKTAERTWEAVERARGEEALRASEEKYRTLFASIDEGFCVVEVLFDENERAVDYRFLDVNPAFERQTGIQNALGKRMREITPQHEPHWFDAYGRVARTGEPVRFENRAEQLHRFFDVYAFRIGPPALRKVGILSNDITERKRAQEELSRAHERINNILDSTTDCFYSVDRDFRFTYVNPRTEEYFGMSGEEFLGRDYTEVLIRALGHECLARQRKAFEEQRADHFEFSSPTTGRWVDLHVFPAEWGLSVFFRDITEKREAEERLQKALGIETVGVLFLDAEGTFTDANDAFLRMSGFNREQIAARRVRTADMTLPEWMPRTEEALQELKATGRASPYEKELRRPDGSRWWGLFAATRLGQTDAVEFVLDITRTRGAQAALHESEELFRLLVEGARDYAMFLLDREYRITFWSAGAARVFGWSEAEALGQQGDLIFTSEDRETGEPAQEVNVALARGRAEDRRWHVRKDGSRLFADGVLTRLDDERGNPRGFVKVARDVTAQRAIEEALHQAHDELQRAHDELEQRVVERTASLTQALTALETALSARQQAEVARDTLRRRLVSAEEEQRLRISRDLHDQTGQDLTALSLKLSALQDVVLPAGVEQVAELKRLADQIARDLHHLAVELRPTALDDIGLPGALEHYVEEWATHFAGGTVDLDCTGFESKPRLPQEIETTIYRVVQEALTNVLRHARAGHVDVLLARRPEQVLVTVEDNGIGFEADGAEQAEEGGGRGTGRERLGLLGMRERAELSGGTLEFESSPGSGATVILRIPLPPRPPAA